MRLRLFWLHSMRVTGTRTTKAAIAGNCGCPHRAGLHCTGAALAYCILCCVHERPVLFSCLCLLMLSVMSVKDL